MQLSDKERRALNEALTDWRWLCAIRYLERVTLARYCQQVQAHNYELYRRGDAQ